MATGRTIAQRQVFAFSPGRIRREGIISSDPKVGAVKHGLTSNGRSQARVAATALIEVVREACNWLLFDQPIYLGEVGQHSAVRKRTMTVPSCLYFPANLGVEPAARLVVILFWLSGIFMHACCCRKLMAGQLWLRGSRGNAHL